MNYRQNGSKPKLFTETAEVQICPIYYYQSGHISMKNLWLLQKFTEIGYYDILTCLNILKGCSFINFISAHEEILPEN